MSVEVLELGAVTTSAARASSEDARKYRASPSSRVIRLVETGDPVPALVGRVVPANAALPEIVGDAIVGAFPKLVRLDAVTPELSVAPVSVPAGATKATVEAAVTRPATSIEKIGIIELDP